MKYYLKCKNLLGNKLFRTLSETFFDRITSKFSNQISVNEFVKILEINIDAILMLGIAQAFPEKRENILNELDISKKFLVCDSIFEFENEFNNYINTIATKTAKK